MKLTFDRHIRFHETTRNQIPYERALIIYLVIPNILFCIVWQTQNRDLYGDIGSCGPWVYVNYYAHLLNPCKFWYGSKFKQCKSIQLYFLRCILPLKNPLWNSIQFEQSKGDDAFKLELDLDFQSLSHTLDQGYLCKHLF